MENTEEFSEENFPPLRFDDKHLVTPGRGLPLGRLFEVYNDYFKVAAAAFDILSLEDRIAATSYEWAAGLEGKDPESVKEHQADIKKLTIRYIETGLAGGPQQAEQMIRDIEAQGRSQVPGTPPR